jgi:uncharacterized protein YukE
MNKSVSDAIRSLFQEKDFFIADELQAQTNLSLGSIRRYIGFEFEAGNVKKFRIVLNGKFKTIYHCFQTVTEAQRRLINEHYGGNYFHDEYRKLKQEHERLRVKYSQLEKQLKATTNQVNKLRSEAAFKSVLIDELETQILQIKKIVN